MCWRYRYVCCGSVVTPIFPAEFRPPALRSLARVAPYAYQRTYFLTLFHSARHNFLKQCILNFLTQCISRVCNINPCLVSCFRALPWPYTQFPRGTQGTARYGTTVVGRTLDRNASSSNRGLFQNICGSLP